MSMDSFLQFFFAHNQAIINWLFVFVLILSALVALLTIFERRSGAFASSGGGESLRDVELALRKVIEEKIPAGAQAQSSTTAGAAGAARSADQEDMVPAEMAKALQLELESKKVELQKLQTENTAREKAITELQANLTRADAEKAQAIAAGSLAVQGEENGLKAQIKELQSKLAEYAIIEDDIADLCLYKEENARLKEEVERLKAQTPLSVSVAPPLQPAVPPAPKAAAVEAPPATAAATTAAATEATAPNLKLVATPEAEPLSAETDTDRMLAEMASLDSVGESEEDPSQLLAQAGDPEKLDAEATAMNTPIAKGS